MSFKSFSIFNSGRHFVQPSGAILVILVEGHWWNTSVQIFWSQPIGQGDVVWRFSFFLALAAILFNGAEPLQPSWIFDRHNFSLFRSRGHPVATEQVLAQSDLRFEKRYRKLIFKLAAVVAILDFSIGSFIYFVSHKRANAHHQVSI